MPEFTQASKILVLGLDGMDPDLLLKWCDSGDLPVLAKLREEGTWGRLQTPQGLADDAVWASFATGTQPGVHGKYSDFQFDPNAYTETYTGARPLLVDPFWVDLSQAGNRVAIIDVPKCPLTPGLNGIQLVDWRVHGRTGRTRSHPEELAAEVIKTYGDDQNDIVGAEDYLCGYARLSEQGRDELHDRLLHSIDRKGRVLQAFLKSESWNLFVAVFKESHCAGHHFWEPRASDGSSAGEGAERPRPVSRLKSVYKALDKAIGDVLAETDKQTPVLIFSDLGMSDNVTGNDFLESVLLRLEPNPLFPLWEKVYSQPRIRGRLRRYLNGINRRLRTRRSAFQVHHNEISGAIRMNVEGRERRGRLLSGPALSCRLDELEHDLRDLRDPVSGEPIVAKAIRTENLFPGTGAAQLPDLLVVWRRDLPISGAQSEKIGTIVNPSLGRRPGNHVAGGIFFARGLLHGLGEVKTTGAITDLAPTISAALGVKLPHAQGELIPGLVDQVGP